MKHVVATLLFACTFSAHCGPPTKASLNGVALGSTPEQVIRIMNAQYPNCEISAYGFPAEVHTEGIGQVSVWTGPEGGDRNCGVTRSASEQSGHLSVQFVSKEVDGVGGAVDISFDQFSSPGRLPAPTLGELFGRLKAEYGEPTESKIGQSRAIGPTDAIIPNLLLYQLYGRWFDRSPPRANPCTEKPCRQVEMYVTLSAHAPPGMKGENLAAGSVRLTLRDALMLERERVWYVKKRDSTK